MLNNVSELISIQAKEHADKKSIVNPIKSKSGFRYEHYTFSELENRINQIANRLDRLGVRAGHKVLFFVKPNLDFCAITFALFRMGAVVVFIDPGMKREYFLTCIKELNPDVLIGIPIVHILRRIYPSAFGKIKININSGDLSLGGKKLFKNIESESNKFTTYKPQAGELAAILYTSGGTGKPKGVEYTHEILINQTKMLQEEFSLSSEDIDVPGFPLFSFFTLAMGMTSVIPAMNPSKPAKADPKKLYQNIIDSNASFVAGSPAIWERLAYYCYDNNLELPSVKYMVMFGAPVKEEVHKKFAKVLPNGTTYTPYGATECLPVANISGKFLIENTIKKTNKGEGICIGKPFAGVEIKIIENTDGPIESLSQAKILDTGIGEIIVHSKNVTQAYYDKPTATKLAKISEGNKLWHRMGDVGYFDDKGRLWFCGRKKHILSSEGEMFYPIMVEGVFNQLDFVKRCALVKPTKFKKPILLVEPKVKNKFKSDEYITQLEKQKTVFNLDESIEKIYLSDEFIVDTRHNIKIDRTKMAREFKQ